MLLGFLHILYICCFCVVRLPNGCSAFPLYGADSNPEFRWRQLYGKLFYCMPTLYIDRYIYIIETMQIFCHPAEAASRGSCAPLPSRRRLRRLAKWLPGMSWSCWQRKIKVKTFSVHLSAFFDALKIRSISKLKMGLSMQFFSPQLAIHRHNLG